MYYSDLDIGGERQRCKRVTLQNLANLPCDAFASIEEAENNEIRARRTGGSRREIASLPVIRLSGPLFAEAYEAGLNHSNFLHI